MDVYQEAARLWPRRFTGDDADLLIELDSAPVVMHFLTGGSPTAPEEIRLVVLPRIIGYYERSGSYGLWAAFERATGDFLGWFHLRQVSGAAGAVLELGYRLRRWRGGRATRPRGRGR